MTKTRCWWLVALTALAIGGAAGWIWRWEYAERTELTQRYRRECPMRLGELAFLVDTERRQNGDYPPSLSFVVEMFPIKPWNKRSHIHPLLCPGSDTEASSAANVEEWSDYLYVNWSGSFGTNSPPALYPLIYDRRLSHHNGGAIYVVRVDGSVIWDPGAAWLKEFANVHPEYRIPMPEADSSVNSERDTH